MPVNAALASGAAERPIIRAQAPDAPTNVATTLVLPPPEALGLAPARLVPPQSAINMAPPAADTDWNDVRGRLRKLNAVAFHLDQVAAGHWRATLVIPQAGQQTRQLEASAATDSAALMNVLQQAEAATQRR